MKSHLKVKVYSLSAEMAYIHRQEEKWKQKAKWARIRQKAQADEKNLKAIAYCETNFQTLRDHRNSMRPDARHTHLTYGFMRNVPYSKMEFICYGVLKGYGSSEPNWERIEQMVARFSGDETVPNVMQKFSEWLDNAKKWYEGNEARIKDFHNTQAIIREALKRDAAYQAEKKRRSATLEALGRALPKA